MYSNKIFLIHKFYTPRKYKENKIIYLNKNDINYTNELIKVVSDGFYIIEDIIDKNLTKLTNKKHNFSKK